MKYTIQADWMEVDMWRRKSATEGEREKIRASQN